MKKTNYLSFLGLFLCLPAWADDFLQLKTFEHLHLKKEAFAYAKTLQQPDVDTQVLITKIYLENNQYQKANALINQILQNYPQDSDAYLLKIIYFEKQEHFKEALNWTEIALLFYPFNTEFYPIKWRLAQVLQTSKKTITTPLDVDAALKSAQAELKNNHYAKVCPLLTPYIQQYPKYIDLYLVCIQAHIQMKAYSKGLALTQKGLIYAPKHLVLLKKQADLKYLMNQKSKEKVKAIEKASIPQT
ncbi:MAG: hypothetical protein QG556_295, partial [Pseudomonadota bacterium]|nr:hypothetical protein [Pseudomonadota bacterium]